VGLTTERPTPLILRIWHGWTARDNADSYQQLLDTTIAPGIIARQIPGVGCQKSVGAVTSSFRLTEGYDPHRRLLAFVGGGWCGLVVPLPGAAPRP